MQQEEQVCRPIWRRSGVMPEEMGKLREKGIQKTVWKGMHYDIILCHLNMHGSHYITLQ